MVLMLMLMVVMMMIFRLCPSVACGAALRERETGLKSDRCIQKSQHGARLYMPGVRERVNGQIF